ncbi:MAG: hypothetical protein KBT34_03930 [Prevotella sp.]|nr:hypothetical protein [Candidatus Prevotella equi]
MTRKIIISTLLLLLSVVGASAQKISVSILGDSYSTFADYVEPDTNLVWYPAQKNDVRRVEDTWWHQLITDMGWKLCKNNSYSGSTICYRGYNAEDYRLRSFENRADDLGNPDIIFIFGGTNDSWSGARVGDNDSKDLYTYRPALNKMLGYMVKRYINVKIYFILNSELRQDINEATLELCKLHGVPVIQLHDIDKQMGHPSVKGMKSIAQQIKQYLK